MVISVLQRSPGKGALVNVKGEVSLKTSVDLKNLLLDLCKSEPGGVVGLVLRDVHKIDVWGVGVLLSVKETYARQGGRFILVAPGRMIRKVLSIHSLDSAFEWSEEDNIF